MLRLREVIKGNDFPNKGYDKEGENIWIFLKLSSLAVFAVLGVIFTIYVVCLHEVNMRVLNSWALITSVSTIFKCAAYYYLYKVLYKEYLNTETAVPIIILVTLPEVISFSSLGFLFFDSLDPFRVSFIALVLDSIVIAGAILSFGLWRILWPYFLPICITTFCVVQYYSSQLSRWYEQGVLVVIVCTFIASVSFLAGYIRHVFSESYDIRFKEAEANKKLQEALKASENANVSKSQFLASVSHDLRQPLHALSLFSAALNMQRLEGLSKETSENIHLATQALSKQLDVLFDLSKLDADVINFDSKIQDIKPELDLLIGESQRLSKDKNIQFEVILPDQIIVSTDVLLFQRVIQNLLSNAFKYTHTGIVKLEVIEQEDVYLVKVTDTGEGIAEDHQTLIFDEFYQVGNKERNREKGLGLGLAIVKRLCEKLNIPVDVCSQEGQGSVFSVTLAKASLQRPSLILNEKAEYTVASTVQSVLVIDDDPIALKGTETLLSLLGYKVFTASTKEQALLLQSQIDIDIMVVDFRLEGESTGLDIIQEVYKLDPEIRALIVSADKQAVELKEAEEQGLTVLSKPVQAKNLEEVMVKLLAGKDNNETVSVSI